MASPESMEHLNTLTWNDSHLSFIDHDIFVANFVCITFGGKYRYKRRRLNPSTDPVELDRQEVEIQYRRLKALIAGRADIFEHGDNSKKLFPNQYEAAFLTKVKFNG